MAIVFRYKVHCFKADGSTYHEEVDAMATDTPGIILTPHVSSPDTYCLTHRRSGFKITSGMMAGSSDVFSLLRVAAQLGKVANWRRQAKNLLTKEVGLQVADIFRKSGVDWVRERGSKVGDAVARRVLGIE